MRYRYRVRITEVRGVMHPRIQRAVMHHGRVYEVWWVLSIPRTCPRS